MKISLKELVENAKFTQESDLKLIERWFIENDMQSTGLELISKLAETQLKKVKDRLEYAQIWIPCVNKTKDRHLDLLQEFCILDKNLEESPILYEWAKTNIPAMEVPKIFFMPTLDYLKKYGISFKESEENE